MAKFTWEGLDRNGTLRKGSMEASDEDAVVNRLRADQITPKQIKRAGFGNIDIKIGTGVVSRDILVFTRQLATMIDAGLPLVQCLDILGNQAENQAFGKILFSVKSSVESGASFSDALRRHPRIFDQLYVNLVAAGEVGGILDTILNRLATYIEKAEKLKRQVKSAMFYPIAILVVSIAVILVMLIEVIPTFQKMYEGFGGAALPAPTQFVIDISNGLIHYWYLLIAAGVGIALLVTWVRTSEQGRKLFDAAILNVPVLGPLLRKVVVARFTRTLGTLLNSGVPILDSLEICAKTAGNTKVEAAIIYSRRSISEGKDMATPLLETKVFPSMVVEMVGVGEQTGTMDQMLNKIADFYEEEVDVAVTGLTSLLEPIMMAFLGVVVGGLIVAMYLPVFEMAGAVEGG